MNKNIVIAFIVLLLLVGGYYVMAKPKSGMTQATNSQFVANKTVDVKGANYSFDVKEIRVKLNDKVKINFTNQEGFHDFRIDEFNVATKQIPAGQTETAEFVANKKGTFQYYCSVGQHRANGMWGNLIVE